VTLEGVSGDGHSRTGPSAGSFAGPQGLPAPPPGPIILIKEVRDNYRESLSVNNSAGGVAVLALFCCWEGWDVNGEGSFYACQLLLCRRGVPERWICPILKCDFGQVWRKSV